MAETTLKLLKVIEDKDIYIEELSKQLIGYYYTCTRVLLDNIIYNLVSGQISGVGDNSDSYKITADNIVIIFDLLESKLNQ